MADLQAEGRDRRRRSTALEAIHRRKTGALLRAALRMGAARRRRRRGEPRGARRLRHRRSAWRSRSSTTCSTCRGTRPSWASGSARIPGWASGRIPGSWASREAAAGPGSWPTRPSRRWRRWARAATGCGRWPWIFWKGIADEQHRCCPGSSRRPTSRGSPSTELEQLAAEMRERADRRRRPPRGPLRQQPRRRRALPGPAPDLRLPPGPPDLGHRPPDLPAQADHRPGRPSCTRSGPRGA